MKLIEVGLIDLHWALPVKHTGNERVGIALVFGGRSALAIAKKVVAAEHYSSSGSFEPLPISVVACKVVSIPEELAPPAVELRPELPLSPDPSSFWPPCPPLVPASDVSCFGLRPFRTVDSVSFAPINAAPLENSSISTRFADEKPIMRGMWCGISVIIRNDAIAAT